MNDIFRSVVAHEELERMKRERQAERPRLYIEPPMQPELEPRVERDEEEDRGVIRINIDGSIDQE